MGVTEVQVQIKSRRDLWVCRCMGFSCALLCASVTCDHGRTLRASAIGNRRPKSGTKT